MSLRGISLAQKVGMKETKERSNRDEMLRHKVVRQFLHQTFSLEVRYYRCGEERLEEGQCLDMM